MPNKRKTIEEIVSDAQKGTPLPKATQSHTKAGAERVAELSRMTLDEALEQGGHTRRPGVPLPKATQLMPTTKPRVYGLSNQTVRFDSTDAGSTFGTYLPKAAQTTHGAGGRVNAEERAKRQKTTVLDVLGNPMYYASKAEEAILDPIADTAWRVTHPNAAKARDEERQKANAQLKEAEKPTLGKTVGGMVVKGADQAVTGITSTADWLLGNAMRELGWENNPISTLNRAAQANKAANEEYYAKNLANASKAVKIADELGTATVAALPDLVIAYLTGGGSLAAEGSGALAKGGAKLAGREAAAQTQNVVKRVTSEMYRNPQFWTSFARVAGPGYEQAKADGASEWEANMYALANGIMNAAVEVGGGIQNLPKELQKTTNAIWTWIKSNAEEGTEEVVQGVIERGLQNLIYGKQNPLVSVEDESAVFNPLTAAKEFGGGFAVGGILGGGPAIANIRAGIERGRVQNALAAAQESAENAARAEKERAKLGKAAPALRLDNPLPTAAQQSAIEVLQDAMEQKPVTEQGVQTVLKERNLARQFMAAMGQETSENISDADLETALRNTIARQTGQPELAMDPEKKARYDAAETETAKTGILYGASDEDIQSVERLGQAVGRKILFFAEEGQRDGYYDKRTGILYVNAKSETPVAQIVAHELTHSTEMAEVYAQLAQHIMRKLAKDGNLETLQMRIREIYDSHEVELSSEDLDHEVVAYFVEHNLLTDEESIVSLVQEDRTLGQRIRDMLDRILAKINKGAAERAFIQQARDLYARALEGSGVTSSQQIQDLNDQWKRGEITEEEYDAAFDRAYNAEDALRADVQNSFAGPRAKTADLEQLRTAKAMLEEDVDPETIRQQTGWFQGADGKWRIEIEARDTASRMDMSAEERKNTPPDTGDENTVFAEGAQRADDFIPGDIDEETVQKGIQEVAEMDSVSDISGTEFSVGEKDLITQVSEFFDRIGNTAFNSQLGDVTLNRRGVKDDIAHGIGRNKAAAFAAVPDVLEKGRVIDFQKNWKGRGLDTAVIAAPITINGEPYLAGVVLHRSNSENKFYLHEVLTEKNEALPFKTGTSKGTPGGNAPSVFSLLQKVREVKRNNGVPAPPKSSTLQNSFSAPAETGVPLPKAGAENVSQEERLPKKAQNYIQRARRFAMEKIANAMSIPKAAQREFLRGPLTEATEEYLKTGKISEKTRGKLFQAAWDEGRVVLDDFYNQYKDVKDTIRKTALNITEVRRDFADFGDFVKRNRGTLRLVKEGGMGIDAFYEHTLHPMAPDLFPMTFTNEADQLRRIEEIAHSIVKVEKSLDEHWGREADDFRTWAENDFEAAMDELAGELARAKRYEADKTETKVEPITAETVTQAYKDLKEQRRTYEKASARNLLTDADEIAVGRILRGEDSVEGLDPKKYNVKGIRDVVEAKREYEKTARRIRDYKAQQKKARRDMADTYLGTVMAWKDKKTGVQYSRETMERNIRDIVANKEDAKKIIAAYFTPVHTHEAAATRMKNVFRERVRSMNLSRKIVNGNTVSEAHAVQLLGEAQDNMRYLEQHKRVKDRDGKTYEEWQTVVNTLWATSPKLNRAKIEGAVEEFRAIYDELFQQMNETRIRNGYEPINYRRGYFPHFQPGDSSGLLEQFSRALGISADVTSLPTTINGLTHQFRPGIRWFGNAQERLGFNTTYDAVEGFDKYIEGAADVIHHTDDIQNLRALSDQIRYRSSDKGVREQVDRIRRMDNLTDAEKQTLINETYDKGKYHLSNFVVELEEYTNLLANKRSRRDRDMEQLLGRNMYNLAKRFESRVAANMVAINPGSWLTNFIPLTQGWTTTDSRYMLQGMWESLRAIKNSDGMLEMSDFLTNRKGSEPLVKMWEQSSKAPNAWQKVSAFGGRAGEILSSPMEYIDQFTAGSLVRARYHQNVARGMSEDASIHEADAWAAGIMADRSKGSTPTVFNQQNPLKKVFTQFQLEVNNELSWLAKDVPDELKEKTLGAAALAIFKFLVGTYLFNDLYEALVGRRSALDPLGILNDTVGDLTGYKMPNLVDLASGRDGFETEKKDLYDTAGDVGKEVAENLPFIGGVLGGGRVPISSALPNVDNLAKAVGKSGLSGKKRAQLLGKELGNTAAYVVLPFGGSQLKKAYQGVKAVAEGGSYSMDNEGNKLMQYPVYNDSTGAVVENAAKALLFGKSSLPGAREWVESGFDSFSKKETAAYQGLTKSGVKQKDAYEVMKQLHAVTGEKKKDQKSDIIRKSKLTDDQKQALYKALLTDKGDKTDEKFTAMRKAGMTWDQVMDAYDKYREYNDSEGGKSSTRATEFSAWLDDHLTERQAEVAKEQLKIWAMMPASTDRYEKMRDLGLNSSDAIKLSETLTALEPAEGKSEPTDIQKYQAIVSSGISDEAKAAGIKSVMRKDVLPKYEAAEKYKISPDDYVAAYAKVIELREKYGKSQVNAAIAKEAIDSIPGLTKKQRAALWQVQKKNFNPSQNPYDVTVGQIVYNIQYGLDGNAVVLP